MSEVSFKLRYIVKNNFFWTRVSAYPCVVKQLANPGRLFNHVYIITASNLIEGVRPYFKNLKPACGGVDHLHAGQTNNIPNDSAAWVLLSYRLSI